MLRYAFADKKHCKIVREVIAIVYEEIVRLQGFSAQISLIPILNLTSSVYTVFNETRYSIMTSVGSSVLPSFTISIGLL